MSGKRKVYVPPYDKVSVFYLQKTLLMEDMRVFKMELRTRAKTEFVSSQDLARLDVYISRYETLKSIAENK